MYKLGRASIKNRRRESDKDTCVHCIGSGKRFVSGRRF